MLQKAVLIVKVLCAALLLVIAAQLLAYHYRFIVYPFPNEYREGAVMTTTAGLVRGVNPYDLGNQPQYMNDYGIFYSIVAYPFAKVFGVTMLVHRLVTAFFIFACCGLMLWVMRRRGADWLLSAVALVIFYAGCVYPGTTTPMANPSSLGVFIFLCALFVPWSRGFSYPTLFLSAALGILGYYTKPYCLLSVPMMALYLFLFVSKRKACVFSAAVAVLGVLSILFVDRVWNCYFANCFFLHTNPGWMSWRHSVVQLKAFINLNNMVLWASGAALAAQVFLVRQDLLKIWRERRPFSFVLYCALICSLVLIFFLGKHEEAYLWYYFHLVSPFLLICMAVTLSRHMSWAWIFLPMLLWNCWTFSRAPLNIQFDANDQNWLNMRELIKSHKDILNSPLIAPLLVENNLPVYDNGLSEYFKKGAFRENELVKIFSKGDPRIMMRYYVYLNEVRGKIKRREFDLAILAFDYSPLVPGELTQYYRPLGQVVLKAPSIGDWKMSVWVPNDK
ncbi:MAG: hypothetical protein HQL20_04155 [Candidatus Omnitrophica bacterium]|nr:hypothetical protein [Candidatus Omnitrophota bacterium]